jgi:hypothetical protein
MQAPEPVAKRSPVRIAMREFAFRPARLLLPARGVTLSAANVGTTKHELVLIRTDKPADALPLTGNVSTRRRLGRSSESLKRARARRCAAASILRPAATSYVPGHYKAGMHGTVTVR